MWNSAAHIKKEYLLMVYFFHQYKKIWRNACAKLRIYSKSSFTTTYTAVLVFVHERVAHREQKSPWKSAYIRLQMAMFWNAFVSVVVWQELIALFLEGFLEWIKKPQHFNRPPCESNSRKHLACISGFYVGDKLQSCKHNMRTNSKSY